ncbi:MAG: trypsin-like peptidase domain-containing protein [Flavobacteriaceae bacterium]
MKKVFGFLGIAVLGGAITLGGYKLLIEKPQVVIERTVSPSSKMVNVNHLPTVINNTESTPTNFTEAAEKTVNAVVHVKNTSIKTQKDPWGFFYGRNNGQKKYEQVGTGSGVIISSDGFIITNNHVIDGASDIEITLNDKKKYKADLIGADATNDIALLKISSDEKFPFIPYGNSDNIKVGEWVLAVGNPYNLKSTVTAGIISAKGRDLEGNSNIDSFIQTDAAVNPGNSGGALVNTRGELIGINTAISSRTGSFIGYSFAVPSNIAKKVIEDIMEFGSVQEAIIGINISLDTSVDGVKVGNVEDGSNADKYGLKKDDIIKKVNNVKISKFSELKGQLTAKRPGDVVNLTIDRNGRNLVKKVTLTKKTVFQSKLGLDFKDLSKKEKRKFGVSKGAKIVRANNRAFQVYNIGNGYVLTKINGKRIENASEAAKILNKYDGRSQLYFEMINPNGEIERYRF